MQSADFLGKGWSFPPSVDHATGKFRMVEGSEDIKQSIGIILSTRINERAMLPKFGSSMHEFVFELPDAATVTLLREEVTSALVRWEPRIVDIHVDISLDRINEGEIRLFISYTERITNNPNNMVFPYYITEGAGED